MTQYMNENNYPFLQENGAFYITTRDILLIENCRYGKNVGIYLMENDQELDEFEDISEIEKIMEKLIEKGYWN